MEKTNWTIIAGIAAVLVVFVAVWLSKNSQSSNSVTTITGSGNTTSNVTNQNQYTTKNTTTNLNISDILNGGLNDATTDLRVNE
ncbi:MAG: hypothetical protein J6P95_04660 [Paludibacteraceae bacterium]|nr:hypothetical protein [Paludibacteraceae bacterium]